MTLPREDQMPLTFYPGDPAKWTPAQRSRNERMASFLQHLQSEGMINPASKASGVSVATIWRWRDEYPAFNDAVVKFMTRTRMLTLEENLYRIANSTDPKMAMAAVRANEFLMRAWDREQYGEFKRVDQTVTVNHIVQLSHDARQAIQERQAQKLQQLRTIDVQASSRGDDEAGAN
ncbi:hypothetical protein [Deinococcus humi]|uniref:Homeodomain phBC6A51-type domain-containing protein n=1 Tax=Deinococcus humi TaxID=662880 RepID=A0A7W8JSR7_9DEIO|nr:hypothetical protein [Deinococcus humi]MBB5362496.1 hypothetical protein [Deinococcus humi]GGO28533.1 hypothetical protein GCM10008949_21240 [Deinococcus humi]